MQGRRRSGPLSRSTNPPEREAEQNFLNIKKVFLIIANDKPVRISSRRGSN